MLVCWETLEAYKHMSAEDRLTEAPLLQKKFCDPTSLASVSADEEIVTALQGKLASAPGSRNAFDDLQHFAWQMLEFGLCQQFLMSDDYKKIQAVRDARTHP